MVKARRTSRDAEQYLDGRKKRSKRVTETFKLGAGAGITDTMARKHKACSRKIYK